MAFQKTQVESQSTVSKPHQLTLREPKLLSLISSLLILKLRRANYQQIISWEIFKYFCNIILQLKTQKSVKYAMKQEYFLQANYTRNTKLEV